MTASQRWATWIFTAAVAVVGSVLCAFAAGLEPASDRPFVVGWVLLATAFALAERYSVALEVRSQAHSLTFAEIPLTLGLIFADPRELVIARIAGAALGLLVFRRMSPVKLIFNVGTFALEVGTALVVFHALLGDGNPIEPAGWLAAFVGVSSGHVLGWLVVSVVMRLAGAPVTARDAIDVLVVSAASAAAACAVALGAAAALWRDGRSWVLLLVIGAALGFFFLSFVRIRERHQALATLHEFTTSLEAAREQRELLQTFVGGVAQLMSAGSVIAAVPEGDRYLRAQLLDGEVSVQSVDSIADLEFIATGRATGPGAREGTGVLLGAKHARTSGSIAARLPMQGAAGLVIVEDRLSEAREFDAEDVQLLETAAGHAAAALQSAKLVNELRDEAAFRAHQALHDDVTDLPNQRGLVEQLGGQLRSRAKLVMLTVRIHSLREVNETLGRAVGDEMLRKVAERLLPIGHRSWCARSGTDEFTLVVPGGPEDADEVANQIVAAFEHPVQCTDVALAVTVGIGVALAPAHGTDGEMLVRRASLAASRSALDGTTITTWAEDRDPYDPQRLTIAADLRDAIPAGELEVHFQPQLDMESGAVIGAEALVRWAHPRLGPLRPDQFIPAAEHTGAIDALTFHVLTVAAQTGRRWHDRGWDIEMAVNLSARNLTSPRFAEHVAEILEAAQFPASSLTLELTESSVMTEAGRALATLDELHALGIELSIDDFGTGYSSLAHLRRLPVGEIKIDKSFVFDLTTNESDEAIVKSMVELGHTLGLRVVVEGVETVEVRDRLAKIGSDRLQGYLVSRPLVASAFESWMQERQVRAAQTVSGTATVVNFQARR